MIGFWSTILSAVGIGLLILIPVAALAVAMFVMGNFSLWLEARAAGVPVTFLNLLQLKFQKLNPQEVVGAMKTLWKAGQQVPIADLQGHLLAGGSLQRLTQAAVAADKAGLKIDIRALAAIDLAGRNIVEAVRTSVEPKVLVCPPPGAAGYDGRGVIGVTRDGVALGVKVRVTVRTRLDKLVGGSGEATVLARVGEGIVTTLGQAASHKEILEHPEVIVKTILNKGLDAGTVFDILSVDVADVDVLDNVNARLQMRQAEADRRIAQARAAQARANAIAQTQEMKAVNLQNAAMVVAAKQKLPNALRTAITNVNFGSGRPYRPLVPEYHELWR